MYLPLPSLPLSHSCSIHLQEIKIRIFKETFSRSLRFSHCSVVIVSSSALSHSCERAGNCRAIRAPRVPFSLSSRRLFPCFLRVIVAIMKLDSARRIQMPSSPSPPSPFLPFFAVFAFSAASAFSLVGAVQKLADNAPKFTIASLGATRSYDTFRLKEAERGKENTNRRR